MALSEKILSFIKKKKFTPVNEAEIKKSVKLTKTELSHLSNCLSDLVNNGDIVSIKKDKYCLPECAGLVPGTISFKATGKAILNPKSPDTPSIKIRAENTGVALHGDFVLVRLKQKQSKKDFGEPTPLSGTVIRVLKRANDVITGTLKKTRNIYYVIPDNPKITHDILVDPPKSKKLKAQFNVDNKILVKLVEWQHRCINPVGEVIEILGQTHTPDAELLAILRKNHLSNTFSSNVLKEVQKIPAKVTQDQIKNRLDCRDLYTINIDPDDAQDFDDALSLEKLEDGKHRVGVHIADVSAYVTPNSQLDKEAKKRGNSTYLVGTVIPMLPKELSNGICSLIEAEDRLTKSVFLTFDKKNKLVDTYFANTVICGNKRLTYHQAHAFLKEKNLDLIRSTPLPAAHQTGFIGRKLDEVNDSEMRLIQKMIRKLWDIASSIRNKRMKSGSLDFDMSEIKIYVDKDGYADRIETLQNDESHQLIEEFMLAANSAVAKSLHNMNLPYISRVHDQPNTKKLEELSDFLIEFGYNFGDLTNRKNIIKFLDKIKNNPQTYTLKIQFLRSLKQACYRAEADGHYGLNKVHYTHFTSPIRRYSDLIVHRIFNYYLHKQGNKTALGEPKSLYDKSKLTSLAEHISITEQQSVQAEREHTKIKLLEFFNKEVQKKNKTSFEAIITEVRTHGLFVELTQSSAFGFISLSSLKDDMYFINSSGTALRGKRYKRTLKVGQKILVQIDKVDFFKKQMDFTFVNTIKS